MKKNNLLLIILVGVLLLTGCAGAADVCTTEDPYGFWAGFWHGFVVVPAFFASLFSDEITIYAVNNTGGWYDFGFVIGIGGLIRLGRG